MLSALLAASMSPSGLKATDQTGPVWPVSGEPIREASCGSVTSHSRTVSSAEPLARVRPSGLKATEWISPVWPVSGSPTVRGRSRSVTSQSRTVSSSPPAASVRPSGLKATERTAAVAPVRAPSSRGRSGAATSHRRTA